jgi:hypothetical protein
MFDNLGVRNLKSLIIRKDKNGDWTGDLLLKRVPQGVPDVLGIPEQAPDWPYETRRDALAMMCSIVNSICIREHLKETGGTKAESKGCATDG